MRGPAEVGRYTPGRSGRLEPARYRILGRPTRAPYVRDASPARVGLVWRAGDWWPRRSIPFDLVRPLVDIPVTWYVVQGGAASGELPAALATLCGTHDIVDAARTIGSLDLLVTIDSMPAHLAGALGVRVWTLFPAPADWRWMDGRDDTPWFRRCGCSGRSVTANGSRLSRGFPPN